MNGPNIKDSTHIRRSKKTGKDILFQPEMKISGKKDEFLTNEFNKQRFIILHAISDADTLIVETAIKLAEQKDTCIIGSDTDLLILSVNSVYKSNNLKKLYIRSETKSNIQERTWLIQELVNKLGDVCCKYILFSHAFLGCDTTSHVFGFGKPQILKMFDSEDFVKIAEIFQSPNSSKEEITVAGEKCFLMLYKSTHLTNSLNELRYIRFHQKVVCRRHG